MLNFIASWRREREAVRELSRLSDRELADLGISRSDIREVASETARDEALRASCKPAARESAAPRMAPAWGAHVRRSVAA